MIGNIRDIEERLPKPFGTHISPPYVPELIMVLWDITFARVGFSLHLSCFSVTGHDT